MSLTPLLLQVAEIAVYGNGITYNECWNMSYEERQIIVDVLSVRAEKMSGKKISSKTKVRSEKVR